jgi:hypothetical protein
LLEDPSPVDRAAVGGAGSFERPEVVREVGAGDQLLSDEDPPSRSRGACVEATQLGLDAELVPGAHRGAELRVLDHSEHPASFEVQAVRDQPPGGLSHALDEEHAGDDRVAGEVIGEVRLVRPDRLAAERASSFLQLEQFIYEDESDGRISLSEPETICAARRVRA